MPGVKNYGEIIGSLLPGQVYTSGLEQCYENLEEEEEEEGPPTFQNLLCQEKKEREGIGKRKVKGLSLSPSGSEIGSLVIIKHCVSL